MVLVNRRWKRVLSVVAGLLTLGTVIFVLGLTGGTTQAAKPTPDSSATVSIDLAPTSLPKLVPKPKVKRDDAPRPPRGPRPTVAAAPRVSGGGQERTALIVGINKAAGSETLTGAVPDAKNIRAALLKYGFPSGNIKMLLDGQATRPAILSELRSLAARTSSNGIAVFGLASHSSTSSFRTSEGARISAGELATHLGAVRGRMWNILSTCYAGGYAIPGVTGPGRIATFSSSSSDLTWEAGSAGTYIVRSMVVEGMIGGKAASSVEAAFNYAKGKEPKRAPIIRDGVSGNLALGPVTWASKPKAAAPKPVNNSVPPPTPAPTPKPSCYGLGCLLGGLLR